MPTPASSVGGATVRATGGPAVTVKAWLCDSAPLETVSVWCPATVGAATLKDVEPPTVVWEATVVPSNATSTPTCGSTGLSHWSVTPTPTETVSPAAAPAGAETTSLAGGPGVTATSALTGVSEPLEAVRVIVPAFVRISPPKVAVPATAPTVVVPLRDVPDKVTCAVLSVGWPFAVTMFTVAPKLCPATTVAGGGVPNASLAGAG